MALGGLATPDPLES